MSNGSRIIAAGRALASANALRGAIISLTGEASRPQPSAVKLSGMCSTARDACRTLLAELDALAAYASLDAPDKPEPLNAGREFVTLQGIASPR